MAKMQFIRHTFLLCQVSTRSELFLAALPVTKKEVSASSKVSEEPLGSDRSNSVLLPDRMGKVKILELVFLCEGHTTYRSLYPWGLYISVICAGAKIGNLRSRKDR